MQPGLKHLVPSLPVALIAAAAGYFLLPWLGLGQQTPSSLFAAGIGLGVIISVITSTLTTSISLARTTSGSTTTAARQTTRPSKPARIRTEVDDSDERRTVFVGNLDYRASPRQLRELFESYGTVHSVRIATDRATRKPRGFGFVEMNEAGIEQAIQSLHGHQLCNRELNLSEAKQRENRY
jgi:hypothetical protein